MSDLRIAIPELEAWVRRFKGADRIVTEELTKAATKSGLRVERRAKERARVDRGTMRRSTTSVVETRPLFATASVGLRGDVAKYGRVMDEGRRPGATPPPVAPIAAWLNRRGADPRAAYAVARAIGRRGIKGDRWLSGALDELKPQIRREFADVPKRVVARLRGAA